MKDEFAKKILLVDDHPLFRQGLRALIAEDRPEARILEAGSIAEATALIAESAGGILIVDITLPDGDGLSLAAEVIRTRAFWRIFIVTMHKRSALVRRARDIGCRGYFLKEDDGRNLLRAFDNDECGFLISPALHDLLADADTNRSGENYIGLTRREKEIFRLFACGKNYKEVAADLGISPRTATSHRYNIFCKLGVQSDLELANIARDLGIIG